MQELFEQWKKMTEKMWDSWKQMVDVPGTFKEGQFVQGKWSSWFGAMRSSFDVNSAWWNTFMDQWEEVFFKTFKDSQFYTRSVEGQLRAMWDVIRKTQKTQMETVNEQMERMERLLRDREEAGQKT